MDALEHVYRDVDSTNTNFLSALILVCKVRPQCVLIYHMHYIMVIISPVLTLKL